MISSTEQLVKAFNSLTLPREQWNHDAHLKVGLWYLLHYSPDESLKRLRQNIKQYNVACGINNTETQGYHETITQFYIWLINHFIQQIDCSQSIDLIADTLIDCYGDKSVIFSYYSKDRLMSKTARIQWIEPDLKSLE